MLEIKTKETILHQLQVALQQLTQFSISVNDELFFYQPADKWSVAQNILHLTTAVKSTIPAFNLPKFIVRLYTGKPNRLSRTYEELVTKYKLKLEQGGRASKRFIPKPVSSQTGKEKIIKDFSNAMIRLEKIIQKKWDDQQLDKYIVPHPLLGKITLRELCYFTIYHTYHHLNSLKERLKEKI